jgi:hypothetical protein
MADAIQPMADAVVETAPVVTINAVGTVSATGEAIKKVSVAANGKRRLNWRERRTLGFTHDNIARVRLELVQNGFITMETPSNEYEPMVRGIILMEADPEVRADIIGTTAQAYGEIDWDNLSRILEMILEFLAKFLPMFLSPTPVPVG